MNQIQIWSTGGVVVMCLIAVAIVGPYAVREMLADRKALRGQFAVGLTVLFAGIAGRLGAAWVFYFTPLSERGEMLVTLHPWILSANFLIAAGAVQCIRVVTIGRFGEWVWAGSVAISALIAFLAVR